MLRPSAAARLLLSAAVPALLVTACSPAHDWREHRIGEQGLVVLLPCRPQQDQRVVTLAGATVPMRLAACTAAGRTWAAAEVELPAGQDVAPVMQALADAARRNVQASESTPAAGEGGRWMLSGARPDGQPVQMHLALSHRGRSVLQLTALGPTAAPAGELESFFGAPRWQR
jgi:hypothetical protein